MSARIPRLRDVGRTATLALPTPSSRGRNDRARCAASSSPRLSIVSNHYCWWNGVRARCSAFGIRLCQDRDDKSLPPPRVRDDGWHCSASRPLWRARLSAAADSHQAGPAFALGSCRRCPRTGSSRDREKDLRHAMRAARGSKEGRGLFWTFRQVAMCRATLAASLVRMGRARTTRLVHWCRSATRRSMRRRPCAARSTRGDGGCPHRSSSGAHCQRSVLGKETRSIQRTTHRGRIISMILPLLFLSLAALPQDTLRLSLPEAVTLALRDATR